MRCCSWLFKYFTNCSCAIHGANVTVFLDEFEVIEFVGDNRLLLLKMPDKLVVNLLLLLLFLLTSIDFC